MVKNGDLIHFCDAGAIKNKEFNQDGKKKTQDILEMDVMVGDTMKKISYSPNTTSRDLLKVAWGPNTENWVGETGMVSVIEQLSFGKIIQVLVVKPVTNPNKWAQIAALQANMNKQGPAPGFPVESTASSPGPDAPQW